MRVSNGMKIYKVEGRLTASTCRGGLVVFDEVMHNLMSQ